MTSEDILERIVAHFQFTEKAQKEKRANVTSWLRVSYAIRDFLSDKSELISETIVLPGGAGVVRIVMEKKEDGLEVRSVDALPEGIAPEFLIEMNSLILEC